MSGGWRNRDQGDEVKGENGIVWYMEAIDPTSRLTRTRFHDGP